MKIWGIIATVLLIASLGFLVWQFKENKDLKDQKNTAETNLSTAKSKMSLASKKMEIFTLFFNSSGGPETMNQAYSLLKEINNPTLSADLAALQNSSPGDNSTGNKLMQDLISSVKSDLK